MAVHEPDAFYRTTSTEQPYTPEHFVWTVSVMHQGI